jgi:hypothetical protein
LQGGVVELAAAAYDKRHRVLLVGSRLEFVLERLAEMEALAVQLIHCYLFCLIGTQSASIDLTKAIHLLAQLAQLAQAERLSGPFL